MALKVVNMKAYSSGNTRAFFDLEGDKLTIKGFTLFANPKQNGRLAVGLPSKQGSDGKYYKTVLINDDEFYNQITRMAEAEYNRNTDRPQPQQQAPPANGNPFPPSQQPAQQQGDYRTTGEAMVAAQQVFDGTIVDPDDDIPF